jgi:hypothetical protein
MDGWMNKKKFLSAQGREEILSPFIIYRLPQQFQYTVFLNYYKEKV